MCPYTKRKLNETNKQKTKQNKRKKKQARIVLYRIELVLETFGGENLQGSICKLKTKVYSTKAY